jgi:predicted  nucleic acid-binding Zn-ribbon protein
MNVTAANRFSNIRDRSRSARERSRSLRVTSQQLRESLESLRAYAAEVNGSLPEQHKPAHALAAAAPLPPPHRTPLDFAGQIRERVHKARVEAQALRRRSADLRNQAAEFRARSENLRSNSATM